MASAADSSGNVTVWGSGFGDGETISLMVDGSPVGSATANSGGAFSATASVSLADGVYSLWAIGGDGSEATAPLLVGTK